MEISSVEGGALYITSDFFEVHTNVNFVYELVVVFLFIRPD